MPTTTLAEGRMVVRGDALSDLTRARDGRCTIQDDGNASKYKTTDFNVARGCRSGSKETLVEGEMEREIEDTEDDVQTGKK
jgi:hypothetical protein